MPMHHEPLPFGRHYAVSADGQRLLVATIGTQLDTHLLHSDFGQCFSQWSLSFFW
jgi:hypothetical protein